MCQVSLIVSLFPSLLLILNAPDADQSWRDRTFSASRKASFGFRISESCAQEIQAIHGKDPEVDLMV